MYILTSTAETRGRYLYPSFPKNRDARLVNGLRRTRWVDKVAYFTFLNKFSVLSPVWSLESCVLETGMNLEGCLRQLRVVRRAEDINVVFQWYSLVGWVKDWISQVGHDTVSRRRKEFENQSVRARYGPCLCKLMRRVSMALLFHYHQCHQDASQMTTMRSSNEPEGLEYPLCGNAIERRDR